MKIRILGSAPGIPVPGKNHSALWFYTHGKNILIDCGEGISHQLMKYELDGDVIDYIIISHYHPDHVSGFFMLIQMMYLQQRVKNLTVFLPERVKDFIDAMHMFYTIPEKFHFSIFFKPMEELTETLPFITPVESDHLQSYSSVIRSNHLANEMKSYSFVLEEEEIEYDKKVIYTSDIQRLETLGNHLVETNILIVDALHPKAENIYSLCEDEIERVILTHGISQDLQKMLKSRDKCVFEIADENMEIIL